MNFDVFKALFKIRIEEMRSLVEKTNKSSVLVIQQFPLDEDKLFLLPNVRESITNILAFVELGTEEVLNYILEQADGVFDAIAMDSDLKCKNSLALVAAAEKGIKKSKYFQYSDNTSWADAAIHFVNVIEGRNLRSKKILLTGAGPLVNKIAAGLYDFTHEVLNYYDGPVILESEMLKKIGIVKPVDKTFDFSSAEIVIGGMIKKESLPNDAAKSLKSGTHIYDVGIGNFSGEFIKTADRNGCKIYRLDTRVGISSLIINLLETEYLVNHIMGKVKIKNVEIVSGGLMGADGAIIVDNVNTPSHIVGVADGGGKVKVEIIDIKDKEAYNFVEKLLK